jgi:RNA 2',3'-cyclic 3'-phosphodiesterase
MKRLFVALEMPESVQSQLSGMLSGVPEARWVDPENFHLTLRFIGEVDEPTAEEIAAALSRLRMPSFTLVLDGMGYFESRGRLRALWVGVRPEPALDALRRKVESTVVAAGLEAEKRKFKPHVTLARFSRTPVEAAGPFLAMHAGIRSTAFAVESMTLFESVLGQGAPTYYPELEIPLLIAPGAVVNGPAF